MNETTSVGDPSRMPHIFLRDEGCRMHITIRVSRNFVSETPNYDVAAYPIRNRTFSKAGGARRGRRRVDVGGCRLGRPVPHISRANEMIGSRR